MNTKQKPFMPKIVLTLALIFFWSYSFSQLSDKDKKKLDELLNSATEYAKNEEVEKAATSYYKAGIFCIEKENNKLAIPYLKEASVLYGRIKDWDKVMKIYSNLGLLYANTDEYDKSLNYFNQSLVIRRNIGNQAQISSGLLDYAYVLSLQQNNKDAIFHIIKALDIANEIQNSKLILISYRMLAENYQKIGNEQKAGEYLDKYSSYRQHFEKTKSEELVSDVRIKSIAELSIKDADARTKQLEYELSRKNSEIYEDSLKAAIELNELIIKSKNDSIARVLSETENQKIQIELKEAKLEQNKAENRLFLIFGSGIIVFILVIVIGLLFNIRRRKKHNVLLAANNKKIADQNKNIELKNSELSDAFLKIEEQNKDINASIDYAVNIQKSLLPKQDDLSKYITDSFILFKPRDKVSGDFYWFKEANITIGEETEQKKIFISAIDCTGHGVPGAFLSMLSYNLLDDIVEQKKIYKPSEILDNLHDGVRKSLRQSVSNNRDGMDMALCSYDPQKNILEYAGAKNPLIYIKDGKLHRLKGNVKPIGGIIYERSEISKFQNNVIEIDSPTTVYIFSDGFADQVGQETGRKLMTKFFRNLLADIHLKPMPEQKDILELFLKKWMGNLEQIDDIIVIGFKIFPNKI